MSDAQAGLEKALTALLPALAGANRIYGLGLLESGITLSFEQLLIDAECVKLIQRVMQGIKVDVETLAVEVIKSVGAGKNYLSQPHTLKHMEREQSRSKLIDRRMRNAWMSRGGKDMAERAREEALHLIRTHKPLPLEPSAKAAIRGIVLEAEAEYQTSLKKKSG